MKKENIKICFIDCFDTLVVRSEHPYQIYKRWAFCVRRLYPFIDEEKLWKRRIELSREIPVATVGLTPLFNIIADEFLTDPLNSRDLFISDLVTLDYRCDLSSLRVNKKIISFLEKEKKNNIKIYCITDYHLSSSQIMAMINELGIECVEGVFSSADYGVSKKSGELYKLVLNKLSTNPKECLMVGDNKKVDIINARKNGINTKFYHNHMHKNTIRIKNKLNIYPSYTAKSIGNQLIRTSDTYNEYSLIFYTFCSRLYHEVSKKHSKKIVFLAREGLFLKECFDTYQSLCVPQKDRILTDYLKCSRRAIHSVQMDKCLPAFYKDISPINYLLSVGFSENEGYNLLNNIGLMSPDDVVENFPQSSVSKTIWDKLSSTIVERNTQNKAAFSDYVRSKVDSSGGDLKLVDVGWIGRMQQGIDVLFDDISTEGYYLGVYQNLFEKPFVERHGLIFNKNIDGDCSCYFYIFRSNIQLYEQLLSAPHGSACYYTYRDGKPFVVEKWDENERILYETTISRVQKELYSVFQNMCTFPFDNINESCDEKSKYNRGLALTILRSCLLQTKNRMLFMKSLIGGFSQNFQQQSLGMHFSTSDIEDNKINMITHPDRFVRYFSKLAVILDQKGKGWFGRLLMRTYYCWCRISIRF